MITAIRAAQRLDSRGNPTIQVWVTTANGTFPALVPSGASKGDYEAIELRDDDASIYYGKGVLKAVHGVNEVLGPAIIARKFNVGKDLASIDALMRELDGTADKSNLGANAILGISMACARAAAAEQNFPLCVFIRQQSGAHERSELYILPVPFFNVLNGGVHSGNLMAFQEFMIAPVGAKSVTHAVQMGAEVYQELKNVVRAKFGGSGKFAIDPASSEFFNSGRYDLAFKDRPSQSSNPALSAVELGHLYQDLVEKYPIELLEDPFAQDDWEAWSKFNETCKIELVGDDLLATNPARIEIANEKKACNAMLLKINQIGTITEAIESLGWNVFVSHRSGETTDDFIADLAVGLGTGHLKSGSLCRGERVAKYNRLMDIEAELDISGQNHTYAGKNFRQTRAG